jgi:Ca2+-transporting ATPase
LQILFLNLVTDVFPAFALATGEGEEDVLLKPPRDPAEPLLGRPQWIFIAGYGALITGATLAALLISRFELLLEGEALVSVSFLTLAFAQLWQVFAMRGAGSGLLRNAVTRNPYVWLAVTFCAGLLLLATYVPPLARTLHIDAPDRWGWLLILSCSIAPLILGQGITTLDRLVRAPVKAIPTPQR